MLFSKILTCLFLLTTLTCLLQAQAKNNEDLSGLAQRFVQEFYDWYAPGAEKAADNNREFSWRKRASDFDPALLRALKEDEDAQAKAKEIVGIDFDPFLSSQDPCAPYKVHNVIPKGDRYLVEVDCECENVVVEKPTVTAELVNRDGRWIFVNFRYPGPKPSGSDLLSILRENRRARRQPPK